MGRRRRAQEVHDLALRCSLGLCDSLGIKIQGYLAVGMPQEFLHNLDVVPVFDKQSYDGSPERVPANLPIYFGLFRCRPQVPFDQRPWVVGFLSLRAWAGEDPIGILVIGCL